MSLFTSACTMPTIAVMRRLTIRAVLVCWTLWLLGGVLGVRASPQTLGAPVLKWQNGGCRTTWCRSGWYASPAVADLDGDGKPEIIWTDYRIVVLNGADGSDKWIVANPGGGRGWPGVAL